MAQAIVHDTDTADDRELSCAIADGNRAAMREVFDRHSGPMLRLATRVLRTQHLAEEVVQEVLLRLWKQPDRYDPGRGTLRTFLLAQVHSRAIDLIRADEARRAREESTGPALRDVDDVEREVIDRIEADEIRNALAALPDTEREPLVLAYFGARTYQQVAAELGVPEGTVKSRIRSGLRHLRSDLDEGVSA